NKSAHFTWHLDEIYIKVKGKWCYLYRAIDQKGYTLDIQLRKTRDYQAAYMFMKQLVKVFGEPTVLTTDKATALLCAFNKLKEHGFYKHTTHCTSKYLNNLVLLQS
ncbi:DDE-type integrase/transposase/recombinase, partial [Bacillus cereus]|uniref:DDE-type integrase/transposase/recombinase n=1 Tax=Bacillus cereus TaxID=1396 RepID=UPI001145A75A